MAKRGPKKNPKVSDIGMASRKSMDKAMGITGRMGMYYRKPTKGELIRSGMIAGPIMNVKSGKRGENGHRG